MTRHALVAVAFVISFGALATSANAQSAGAQAEVLFRQGRDLMAAGKLTEACNTFAESQKLEPTITTLLNLAGCRSQLGQLASAWGLFLDAERQTRSSTDPATQQLHGVAQDHAQKLEARVSKLTISVPQLAAVDSLEIFRDKERLDQALWNRALPIDGGTYTITAHAPGANAWSTQVVVAIEGDSKTVEIPDLRNLPRDLAPPAAPPPIKPPAIEPRRAAVPLTIAPAIAPVQHMPSETPPSASHAAPILVGAGALVLLGGAVGFDLWGDSNYNDAKVATTQAQRDSLQSSANDKRYAAEAMGIAGVATVGVAIWLLLHDHSGHSTDVARSQHVMVSPTGITFMGAF